MSEPILLRAYSTPLEPEPILIRAYSTLPLRIDARSRAHSVSSLAPRFTTRARALLGRSRLYYTLYGVFSHTARPAFGRGSAHHIGSDPYSTLNTSECIHLDASALPFGSLTILLGPHPTRPWVRRSPRHQTAGLGRAMQIFIGFELGWSIV